MKSRISKSLTISFAIAAALAMPTAVKAQSSNVETAASATGISTDTLDAEFYPSDDDPLTCYNNGGVYIPGFGCFYF